MDRSERKKAWNLANKEKIKANNKLLREQWRLILIEEIGQSRCKDCDERDTDVLVFDHLHSKVCNVPRFIGRNWKLARSEAAKCDVVCANCHIRRTRKRNNNSMGL